MLTLSITHITRPAPTIRYPQGRRRHSHAAATAINGSHKARSWTYTTFVVRPVPRKKAGVSLATSAGTILASHAAAFSTATTHT